jgi:serine/threonine protein kinase
MNTTRYSRGTASYRAPEVIADNAKFNNRADIWSLGCIIYELGTCTKLFDNDFAVLQCSLTKTLHFPVQWPYLQSLPEPYLEMRHALIQSLQLGPSSRPRSEYIVQLFKVNLRKLKAIVARCTQSSRPRDEVFLLIR